MAKGLPNAKVSACESSRFASWVGTLAKDVGFGREQIGESARIGARWLRKHHRGVRRDIAMRRVARRLYTDCTAVEASGQGITGDERVERGIDMVRKTAEQGHG